MFFYNALKRSPVIGILSSQGGATQLRYQPRQGKYLAAASEKMISIMDAETLQVCRNALKVRYQRS